MLVFADNAWHIIAGFLIFLAGLSVAISQKRLFAVPQRLSIALYLWHSFFCLFYFWYSLNNTADSTLYYIRSLSFNFGFDVGTSGIDYIVSFFSQGLGLSYGNVFLVFNIVGYVGLLSLAAALQAVTKTSRRDIRKWSTLFLFLPGISFWSSAIGKDAIAFAAAGLVTWAALDIGRRMPALILGTLLFLLPRPHMAGYFFCPFASPCSCLPALESSRNLACLSLQFRPACLAFSLVWTTSAWAILPA